MQSVGTRRVSHTEVKAATGFRASLTGLELGALIRLTCASPVRRVVRLSSYGEEGYLFSAAGRIVHATLGELDGEEAVVRMLRWHTGDFAFCELPFPEGATIQRSTDALLALADERADDSLLDALRTPRPSRPPPAPPHASDERASLPPALTVRAPLPPSPPRAAAQAPRILPPATLPGSRSLPPPPPAFAQKPFLHGEPIRDAALIASARVDARGALLSSYGTADQLAQLVAYVAHVVALIQTDFGLDAFHGLHAELEDMRALVYEDSGDVIGVLMHAGPAAQELRQRLGV